MKPVLSRAEVRAVDQYASSQALVPSLLLMENAGRGAAEVIEQHYGLGRRVLVVCGAGNNGGDGFVVARRLLVRGASVRVALLVSPERLKGDALSNYRAWLGVGGEVNEIKDSKELLASEIGSAELLVDAIFGTGLDREVEDFLREAIELINEAPLLRVALDVPSGLDCDTGAALGVAVRASLTVTFAEHKRGLLTPSGALHAGRIELADIGVPGKLTEKVGFGAELCEVSDVARALGRRLPTAHKASAGRVLVLAGSPGKIGAALLVAHGALRAGAGLVTLAAGPEVATLFEQRVLSAMTARLDFGALESSLAPLLESADVVAIGPGIGLDEDARRLVDHVVLEWDGVKVVDADALTHFKGSARELADAAGSLILTPHPGEMGRLIGITSAEVEADRYGAVARAVEATRATVLLKGAHTLIGSPGERVVVCQRASTVLATGGSGDTLTGILAALAAVAAPRIAAVSAAYL
ncbi:MAG TPA: NAD(P)H-hydrate epimerase, partial [Polyangiaceae bacterium]|nr:NAD(P)H-hydrate epimerase [Polyangiaceae bacterium]